MVGRKTDAGEGAGKRRSMTPEERAEAQAEAQAEARQAEIRSAEAIIAALEDPGGRSPARESEQSLAESPAARSHVPFAAALQKMSGEARQNPGFTDPLDQSSEKRHPLRGVMIVAGAVLALTVVIVLAYTAVMLGSMADR